MELNLGNKSVVITGGASNIGRGIALAYAAEGSRITIGDIDVEQAERVAQMARERGATDVQVVRTDVTVLEQAQALMAAAKATYGGVDVLVNSVGWDQLNFFMDTTPEFWERIIRVNYIGVLNCTRAALEQMIPQRAGSIVSLSSDASRQGEPREAVYGGVKAAINSFMKTIAKENGRFGIRCNVVCPGVTIPEEAAEVGNSSMWSDIKTMFTDDQLDKIAKSLPLRKIGRPRDVAGAVVFLSSSAANYITGQVLSVSGGYSMIG